MTEWDDIVDSVRLDEVLDALGIRVISIVRGEHWASCQLPSHPSADSTPSFSINEDTLLWHCFTCNEGGYLPSLAAQLLGFESDDPDELHALTAFQKGVQWLLPYSDGEVESDAGHMEQLERLHDRNMAKKKRTRRVSLPIFNPAAIKKLDLAPLELLEKWHIFEEKTVERFGIRYDPERQRIKGGKEYVGPALVIPHWFGGELVGYQERWLEDDRPKWVPKYTNSDDFPKAETLFAWDIAVEEARKGMPVVVVESSMTTARLYEVDYVATGTFGASVNPTQVRLLRSLPWIILARDEDPDFLNKQGKLVKGAGVRAFAENADNLSAHCYVETIPPIDKAKGDLADLEDDEVDALFERREAVFSLRTVPKKKSGSI